MELGHIDVYSAGTVAYSRDHVFWAKPYATEEDDYEQKYWQGLYFQTLDGKAMFGGYYDDGTLWDFSMSGKVTDTWGGFRLVAACQQDGCLVRLVRSVRCLGRGWSQRLVDLAVGHDSNTAGEGYMEPKEYNAPQIEFAEPVKPVRVYLANSTYTYAYFTGEATDSYAVEITGWLNGTEGKTVTCQACRWSNARERLDAG